MTPEQRGALIADQILERPFTKEMLASAISFAIREFIALEKEECAQICDDDDLTALGSYIRARKS